MALCVCVPARNEALRLPTLLDALSSQDWPGPIPVAIGINNSSDDSLAVVEAARHRHAGRLDIHIVQCTFTPDRAHAGSARRLAMDTGLGLLQRLEGSALVSTDADSRPPNDWLRNIAKAFSRGADMVGGRIEIDSQEPLPPAVQRLRAAWDQYWAEVRAIEDAIDPLAWDPAPRHGDHTGASLAIRAELYLACGGVPAIASGEDRALVLAVLARGGRLVHPVNVYTYVSPRLEGRADGGMAVAMQELFASAHNDTQPMAPALAHWRDRASWRRQLRAQANGSALIVQLEPMLPPMPNDMMLEPLS
ncbi:Glycosyltransferase like family 2 [Sphingobium sp. YR768]|nr:Glycosyltransferase like family 2 [Sphingobium sp. YR768]